MENWKKTKRRPSQKSVFYFLLIFSCVFAIMAYWTSRVDCVLRLACASELFSPLASSWKNTVNTNHSGRDHQPFHARDMSKHTNSSNHETSSDVTISATLSNITERFNQTVTSSVFSTYELLNDPEVGKYLKVKISARDSMNRAKTTGGDFWIAVLDFPFGHLEASTSATVQDHQNGTYTVDLFVGWTGAVQVNIILVHPSEATAVLDMVRNISYPSRIFWNGTFVNSQKKSAYSSCYMDYRGPGSWQDKCSYPNRKALGNNTACVCDKPPAEFTCDSLIAYQTDSAMIGHIFHVIGDECKCTWLFDSQHYHQMLTKGPKIVDMKTDPSSTQFSTTDTIVNQLPPCRSYQESGDGFWKGIVWTSLVCKTKAWYKAGARSIGKCLANKNVYLLGDSTTRQWTFQLLTLLNAPVSTNEFQQHVSYMYKYNRYFSHVNLNITFQFHPQILGSIPVLIDEEMYEVDIIDSLQNKGCNYVVVISPWAHFAQWWAEAYTERLLLLRASVERLQARCPGVPVILKSPHVRNHNDVYSQLLSSDYIIFKLKKTIEEVFRGTAVFYVNIWNMNVAYPGVKSVHMPAEVIQQELSIALSYICQGRNTVVKNSLSGKM